MVVLMLTTSWIIVSLLVMVLMLDVVSCAMYVVLIVEVVVNVTTAV